MFKANNKHTRTTPVASFWCLGTYRSSVSIVNVEQVNTSSGRPFYWLGQRRIQNPATYPYFCKRLHLNPFQSIVAFHIETSHLICSANQMIDLYIKCNTGLKWVNVW